MGNRPCPRDGIDQAFTLVRERVAALGLRLDRAPEAGELVGEATPVGGIWVTGAPGQGSTFTFTLPDRASASS